jgi:hypothetical protein
VSDRGSPAFTFSLNQAVEKYSGAYILPGIVLAAFYTLAGDERYVVEHAPVAPGLLHIYGPHNLRPLTKGQTHAGGAS